MKPVATLTAIPTHIITGFLGAGKTTAILKLLKAKPENERWAILLNEFGEIGIDGRLLQGHQTQPNQVFIREVPGGCMCCASGVPMQIALNQLLKQARPDRLLVEPTGLGHPKEVLKALQAEHYQKVLAIQKVITLVDARKLNDTRYTEHQTFNDQITIADIVVGNKADLYETGDAQRLIDYVQAAGLEPEQVLLSVQGELVLDTITGNTKHLAKKSHHSAEHAHQQVTDEVASELQDMQCSINEGEGFTSVGWRFSADYVFQREQILSWISQLAASQNIERLKAVMKTSDGCFAYNVTDDGLNETQLENCAESRLEIISTKIDEHWQAQLLACCDNAILS